jgi:hypothetical protein
MRRNSDISQMRPKGSTKIGKSAQKKWGQFLLSPLSRRDPNHEVSCAARGRECPARDQRGVCRAQSDDSDSISFLAACSSLYSFMFGASIFSAPWVLT